MQDASVQFAQDARTQFAQNTIWMAGEVVNAGLLVAMLALMAFGIYAIWDVTVVVDEASSVHFEAYNPGQSTASFSELRAMNPDVFGWLTIYGTSIDYPLVQGEDNKKYLGRDATGKHSVSGALFLDSNNPKSFSDFNSIIYGHHMAAHAMFGDIALFKAQAFFDEHKYGNLYYDGRDYGLEIIAFMREEAYSTPMYSYGLDSDTLRQDYLDAIESKALHYRSIGVSTTDRLVLLSTCTEEMTNGRHILVCRITNSTFDDAFAASGGQTSFSIDDLTTRQVLDIIPLWLLVAMAVALSLGIAAASSRHKDKYPQPRHGTKGEQRRRMR